jgi:hypothetical protein
MVTSAGLDKTPSRYLVRLHCATRIRVRMTRLALNQGYLTIYISVWSLLQTVLQVWKRIVHWWITPIFTESSLITEQTIGASPLLSYPGQTSCLSLSGICYSLVREITEPLHRKHDALSCGEKVYETRLWSPT